MWRNSGTPLAAEPGRPLIIRIGKHLRGLFDRMIAASSLVANDPVLDMRHFGWTALVGLLLVLSGQALLIRAPKAA